MKKRFVFHSLLAVLVLLVAVLTAVTAMPAIASTTTSTTTVDSGTAVVREGHLAYADMSDEEYFKFLSEASNGDNNPDNTPDNTPDKDHNNNGSNNGAATGSVYVWNDYGTDRPEYAPYLTKVPEPHGFDSLTEMIMALDADKIDCMELASVVGEYFLRLKGNKEKYFPYMFTTGVTYYLSMGFKEDNKWFEPFNDAIKEMAKDKTLLFLKAQYVMNAASTEATNTASDDGDENLEPVKFTFFPDAETVRIAVTGDMPPLDYVAADGTPAGFNTALLAEIARRLKINIELVNINVGARVAALASGRADGVFWFQYENTSGMKGFDSVAGIKLTEPYYAEDTLIYIGKRRH